MSNIFDSPIVSFDSDTKSNEDIDVIINKIDIKKDMETNKIDRSKIDSKDKLTLNTIASPISSSSPPTNNKPTTLIPCDDILSFIKTETVEDDVLTDIEPRQRSLNHLLPINKNRNIDIGNPLLNIKSNPPIVTPPNEIPKKTLSINSNIISYTKKPADPKGELMPPSPDMSAIKSPSENLSQTASLTPASPKQVIYNNTDPWDGLTRCDSDANNMDNFLPGERLVMRIENTTHTNLYTTRNTVGTLTMTNYKLFFISNPKSGNIALETDVSVLISIPLSSIEKIERWGNQQTITQYCLVLTTKDLRILRFGFIPSLQMRKRAYDCLFQYIFPPKIEYVFAFYHRNKLNIPADKDGWNLYDAKQEFSRMGLPNEYYRISMANAKFSLCSTYPQILAVLKCVSDAYLVKVATFRSRGRLPVLTWKNPKNNVAIFRCAQPNVGINHARCAEDEFFVSSIPTLVKEGSCLFIYDARPKLNAVGNQLAGKGYENTDNYKNCDLVFLNIQNIHNIREAYIKMVKLVQASPNGYTDDTWYSSVESTEWLTHIRQIINGATQMVAKIDIDQCSVLSHCSDGWDRTIQLCSLSQLCLDPFYRTLKGFCILIEKEWLSYGHMFQERNGHAESHSHDQRAPIFQQWLECVYQLIHQFPLAFEFSSRLLLIISDHLNSCRFGTFLYNSVQERLNANVKSNTVSLWTYILNGPESTSTFINPIYDGDAFRNVVLYPSYSAKTIELWPDYWYRFLPHENISGSVGARNVLAYETLISIQTSQYAAIHKRLKMMQEEIDSLKAKNAQIMSIMIEDDVSKSASPVPTMERKVSDSKSSISTVSVNFSIPNEIVSLETKLVNIVTQIVSDNDIDLSSNIPESKFDP